jgi:peptidoglycan hydrolase-like protein with peptidoglycan-binding domain
MQTYTKGKKVELSNNFVSTEFDCKGNDGCCNKTLIDPKLVVYLQAIREHFGKPITITSGYRCQKHNSRVGGASGSRHTKGEAADIIVSGVAPREVAKFAESIGVKGIGCYESAADGYFVHIDTRESKFFWLGHRQESISTFGGSSNNPSSSTTKPGLTTVNEITVKLPTIQKGSSGAFVGVAQSLLLIPADGIFGKDTKEAVIAFQKKKDLKQDGVIGKDTWTSLFN